jgi:hypothetical protein
MASCCALTSNHTVVYEAAGHNVTITKDNEWTGKFDGKTAEPKFDVGAGFAHVTTGD